MKAVSYIKRRYALGQSLERQDIPDLPGGFTYL